MSLVATAGGELAVLDQINGRVARFRRDGSPAGEVKIGTDSVQDLAVDRHGNVLVLDRLADRDVTIYGPDGQPHTRIPIVGGPIGEGGAVTGMWADDSGVWLGREHSEIVRVAGADGKPDADRPTQPGPPTRDGWFYLWARLADAAAGAALLRAYDHDGQIAWGRTIAFGRPIVHIALVDSDARDHVYAAALVAREDASGLHDAATVVLRFAEPSGEGGGSLVLPADPGIIENFRGLAVGDDGTIYQMLATDGGVTITAYAFP